MPIEFIHNEKDLLENARTLLGYLKGNDVSKRDYAKKRISLGRNFVVVKRNNELLFFPSRFMGYLHNTKEQHEANDKKHGFDTDKVISKLFGMNPEENDSLKQEYIKFCTSIVAPLMRQEPKFWRHQLEM